MFLNLKKMLALSAILAVAASAQAFDRDHDRDDHHGFGMNKPETTYYSPLPAQGVGPSGLASKIINVGPYCCPSDAIQVSTPRAVGANDFQWVNVPLAVQAGTIQDVQVCYQVSPSGMGRTFIAQTRLSVMNGPDHSTVMLDDPMSRNSTTATCYDVPASVLVNGTVTLSLKVVIGDASDTIQIGEIALTTMEK